MELYKIFDKNGSTNNIYYVINNLTDASKKVKYNTKADEIRDKLKPILDRRNEVVAHSSRKEDSDYLVMYKTYSAEEYNKIIKTTLEDVAAILNQLRTEFDFESDFDHHFLSIENECSYLVESLILIESQRGYGVA